jgi:hypothetical protein
VTGLRRDGFKIGSVSSATPFGVREETVIYHASNSPASLAAAQAVLHTVSGPAVMALGHVAAGSSVTLLTGSDLAIMPLARRTAPVTTTSSGHHTAPATTTTSSPTTITVVDPNAVKHDVALSAPTAVTQPLAPWDPRSCTPQGTEGP